MAARFPMYMQQHGERLRDQGYRIVPIRLGSKAPTENDWPRFGHSQTEEDVARFVKELPGCGIGITTAYTPGLDIDVRHPVAAMALRRMAVEVLGDAPLRIGLAPKALLLFRTDRPFRKVRSAEFVMPGDKDGDKGHAVEVLGDGQQFVCFAIHPETGQPYVWPDDSPLDVAAGDLPVITEEQARAFVRKAETVLAAHGGKPKKRLTDDDGQAHASNPELRGEPAAIRDALKHIDNNDLHYDDWIAVGMALKGALGEDGKADFLAWSGRSAKDDAAATEKAWKSFRPERIGAGTIFYLAAQNGWVRPGEVAEPYFRASPLSAAEASALLNTTLTDFFDQAGPFALAKAEQRRRRAAEMDDNLVDVVVARAAPDLDPDNHDDKAARDKLKRRVRMRIARQIANDVKAKYGLGRLAFGLRRQIMAAAGLGKTARMVQQIMRRPELWGLHLWIFVPTIALAERLASQFGPGPSVKIMRGRLATRPDRRRRDSRLMCQRPAVVEKAGQLGINIFKAVCNDGEGHKCPHYNSCAYIDQWNDHEPGIRIFASEYLSLPKPLGLPAPDMAIIDESVVETLSGEKEFGPDRLTETPAWKWKDDGDAADLIGILKRIRAVVEGEGPLLARLRATGLDEETLKAAAKIADGGEDFAAGITPETPDEEAVEKLTSLEQSERVKIAKLLHQLAREIAIPRDQSHAVDLRRNWPVRVGGKRERMARLFVWWRKRPLFRGSVPVLLIDADADPEINRQFFGERLEHVPIAVQRNAVVTQCRDATLSRFSLLGGDIDGPKGEEIKAKTARRMEAVRTVIRRMAATKRVLVVAPKPIRRAITGENDATVSISTEWEGATISHFGRIRGVDDWRDHEAVVIVGNEQPPPHAVEGIARAVWWDSPQPMNLSGAYEKRPRGYRMREGAAPGVQTWCHPDPRVQRMLELKRERESAQAIDRLRLIHAEQPKQVLILCNLPIDADVDRLVAWKEIGEGGSKVERALATGLLPLSGADAIALHAGLWSSADAARRDIARVVKNPGNSEIDTISRMPGFSPASYRRVGARGPASTVLVAGWLPTPQLALERGLRCEVRDFRFIDAPVAEPPPAPEARPRPIAPVVKPEPRPPAPERSASVLHPPPPSLCRYAGRALYVGSEMVGEFDPVTGLLRLRGEPPAPDPFSLDDFDDDRDRPRMTSRGLPPLAPTVDWWRTRASPRSPSIEAGD